MKDKFIAHLKEMGFEHNVEQDHDDTYVEIVDAKNGDVHTTFRFNKEGNLDDISSHWKERYEEREEQVKREVDNAKIGEAIKLIVDYFKFR